MNEIQTIVTHWHPLVATGVVLSGLWLGAYLFSWVVQWAWAFVDESEVSSSNWVASKFDFGLPSGWEKVDEFWMYHKYDKDRNVIDKTDGVKLPIRSIFYSYFGVLALIWVAMLSLSVWYISMWVVMAMALAWTMRMARRGQKLLTKHIEDKEAHK